MHPILLDFGVFKVYSFGLMIALAFLLGAVWMMRRAQSAGENPDACFEGVFWIMVAGLLGAKLCYFVFFPAAFFEDPLAALMNSGGLVWYGGMVLGILAAVIFTRLRGIPFLTFIDLLAPPAALGLAIGRVGCLLAGCCYGAATNLPWAITYPAGHETFPAHVHPSPLYETLATLIVCGFLVWVDRHKRFNGTTGWLFLILYGVVRFVLEYYRGDRLVWLDWLNLSASQVISLAGILTGMIALALTAANARAGYGEKTA